MLRLWFWPDPKSCGASLVVFINREAAVMPEVRGKVVKLFPGAMDNVTQHLKGQFKIAVSTTANPAWKQSVAQNYFVSKQLFLVESPCVLTLNFRRPEKV